MQSETNESSLYSLKAEQIYKEAVEEGHTAFFLSQSDETSDIFKCNVGNIPSKANVKISFNYVIELSVQVDGGMKFSLPRVLNPRYSPVVKGMHVDKLIVKIL